MESSLKKGKVLVEAIQARTTSLGLGVDGLGCLGPNLYYWKVDREYTQWLEEHSDLASDERKTINFIEETLEEGEVGIDVIFSFWGIDDVSDELT